MNKKDLLEFEKRLTEFMRFLRLCDGFELVIDSRLDHLLDFLGLDSLDEIDATHFLQSCAE